MNIKNCNFISFILFSLFLVGCGGGSQSDAASSQGVTNRPPVLTSPIESVFPQTLSGTVYTVTASDADGDSLSFSISGADASSFAIDENTGDITFISAPDVDFPGASDGSNFYVIDVTATDPSFASDSQRVDIEVTRYDPNGPFLSTDGAVFIGPNTIVASDPSTFQTLTLYTTSIRNVPDNRVGNNVDIEVRIFDAIFENGKRIEMIVNTEIESLAEAEEQARIYAHIIGQLNTFLIDGINEVYIHPGNAFFSGLPGGIVVHTGEANEEHLPRGVLEEVMAHEAAHAALDVTYLRSPELQQAQKLDVTFISEYARDNPETEDLAESYGAYLIYKNSGRNEASLVNSIENELGARMSFFEAIGL